MTQIDTAACLQAALDYLSRGWSAIALCPPDHRGVPITHHERCEKPGKVPLGKWAEYQTRLPTEAELRRNWKESPAANVGVVLGAVSGIIGIDIDSIEGDVMLHELARGDLPATLMFCTGRDDSFRLLYQLPKNHDAPTIPIRSKDGKEPLKILGNGSQTVMPPSVHPNGATYSWVHERGLNEIEIAPAPKWLLDLLKSKSSKNTAAVPAQGKHLATGSPIPEGGRDNHLFLIASAMRRFGCTAPEIYPALAQVNRRCKPPLKDSDLRRIAHSSQRYAQEVFPTNSAQSQGTKSALAAPNLIRMDQVIETQLAWLWPDWMPMGTLLTVDGEGGVGKSSMLIDLAARITRGDVFPDGLSSGLKGPANVLMIACEDALSSVIKPRCIAARAVESRLFYGVEGDRSSLSFRRIALPIGTPHAEMGTH
jgi:Bifunctional DNA primase/polymerase, N-terminal/AAA domain/Primase C terminal 1 (PriCT-1)